MTKEQFQHWLGGFISSKGINLPEDQKALLAKQINEIETSEANNSAPTIKDKKVYITVHETPRWADKNSFSSYRLENADLKLNIDKVCGTNLNAEISSDNIVFLVENSLKPQTTNTSESSNLLVNSRGDGLAGSPVPSPFGIPFGVINHGNSNLIC